MFCRTKVSGSNTYLQIVENHREGRRVRQRVIATLGRLDHLQASGALDRLLQSACRFSEQLVALAARPGDGNGEDGAVVRHVGPALAFESLWRASGCPEIVRELLAGRRFRFDVERAVFASVLHRIMVSGSDRAARAWMRDQVIDGAAGLDLQHLYRAMAWLGEALPDTDQHHATHAPRCVKDGVEEALFARGRDLFSALDLVFFDTTSLYFTGRGGTTIGRFGRSKDRRPDCHQMVLGLVLDQDGRPVCSEMWPGNVSDVTALEAVARRLRHRFGVRSVCLVADRGMISKQTIAAIEARGWQYILGARARATREVREEVLTDPGAMSTVTVARAHDPEPLTLEIKEVLLPRVGEDAQVPKERRRYVVCRNPAQARRDAASRAAMVADLETKLKSGSKALVGNRGYRRYLETEGEGFRIDADKVRAEQTYDGIWVLRTNTTLPMREVALRYKELWQVERAFRTAKSLLDTRPIFHKCDETIRGHVFCSFLALVLQKELFRRMAAAGVTAEWADILRDLDALTEVEIENGGKRFLVRSRARGATVAILRCVGARLPLTIRRIDRKPTDETQTPAVA